MSKMDKYINPEKTAEGGHSKRVLDRRENPYKDSKQHGKILNKPQKSAHTSEKKYTKKGAEKQMKKTKIDRMGKFTERKSISKAPPPPSRGR